MIRIPRPLVIAAFSFAICIAAQAAEDKVVFIGPSGSNTASGATAAEPMADLQSAVDKGLTRVDPKQKIVVRVLPGTYTAQTLKITAATTTFGHIEITRADDKDKSRPVFDGQGSVLPWLNVVADNGPAGQITVYGMEVKSYSTAINLAGSRDTPANDVSDVVIRNNVFRDIGQQSANQKNPSTAAIRLVNADRVQVINNKFTDIRNRQRCGLLHSLYIAHGSTDNLIRGNTFENTCGDPVRFRDGSGNNRVEGNTFTDAWADAAISDWYCEGDTRDDCSKKYTECPSFDNTIADNKIVARSAKQPQAVKTYGSDTPAGCQVPAQARQRSSGAPQRFISR